MPNLSELLADEYTAHTVDLLRVSEGINERVRALLVQLEADISNKLNRSGITPEKQSKLKSLLGDIRSMTDDAFKELRSLSDVSLYDLAKTEGLVTAQIINSTIGVRLVKGILPRSVLGSLLTNLMIQGSPAAEWWARQSQDLAFRFAQQMRLGLLAGETVGDLIGRVRGNSDGPGIMEISRRNAEALVRTSVQTVSNNARLETFRRNGDIVKGVQQISTLDNRTTEICAAYDHQSWDLDGNPINGSTLPFNGGPPRHWNCRSVLIPLTVTWKEVGVDLPEMNLGMRAQMNGQVAADTNFEKWFGGRSKTQQDQILGAGKAQLWRDGKISFTDLIDRRGDPMSLEQLRAKRGAK